MQKNFYVLSCALFGVVIGLFLTNSAHAQRAQFPSPVDLSAPSGPAPIAEFGGGNVPFDAYGSSTAPQTYPGFVPPPGSTIAPPYTAGTPYPPTYAPGYQQDPSGLFSGWSPPGSTDWLDGPNGTITYARRFFQGVGVEYTWLLGSGGDDLDINDFDFTATFAVPMFSNQANPLFVTPGFGLHLWQGPATPAAGTADLPARAYDAYLDVTWRPQISPTFGAELSFRPGVYSDFSSVNSSSLRFQGRAVGYITLNPTFQVALGAAYLDRNDIKILPVGGVIWTPTPDARYEFIFPRPKLARQLFVSSSNVEWWIYLAGEYGGGAWSIKRADGTKDAIDINDIRVMLGLEFKAVQPTGAPQVLGQRRFVGFIETGFVFDREIVYVSKTPATFEPSETFMLRVGIRY